MLHRDFQAIRIPNTEWFICDTAAQIHHNVTTHALAVIDAEVNMDQVDAIKNQMNAYRIQYEQQVGTV